MKAENPIERFQALYARAQQAYPEDHNAATLATVGADGRPSVRVVLIKSVDERGFTFYTNFHSRKGRELLGNPWAALCLYWPSLHEQVRVEGTAAPVSAAEADAYFATRPRGSQIGAWASDQSQTLSSRQVLESRAAEIERRYQGREVPRPSHWSGFLLRPTAIEFWKGRESRLHDRELFCREGDGWRSQLLFP